jgi:type IV secretory pathway VirB2 component (pilin)
MAKLAAILNVIAWGGFWAFGYLALFANVDQTGQMVTALLLAFCGGAVGIIAFFWLARHAEATGLAKPRTTVPREHNRT